MALKRKPLTEKRRPEYPQSEEYASDRRGFLAMMGAAIVGGVLVFKGTSFGDSIRRALPGSETAGKPMSVTPLAGPPGLPPPPQAQTDPTVSNTPAEQPVACELPVQPKAASRGDVAQPVLPQNSINTKSPASVDPKVRPQAAVPGGIRPPAAQPVVRPQSRKGGEGKAPQPVRVAPRVMANGGLRAPVAPRAVAKGNMPPVRVAPRVAIKGKVKAPTLAPPPKKKSKNPRVEEDF